MKLLLPRLLLGAALASAVASVHAADDFQNIVMVSETLDVSSSRLCLGAPSARRPSDIGCPTYAPSITTAGDVSITGNVSANHFIGDGSQLTGVVAGATDRIVSGTNNATSMIAISATGYISITQGAAATNTGWFDPTRGLVTIGVSSTGPISGTAGYFSGNVGIGTTNPTSTLQIGSGQLLLPNGTVSAPSLAGSSATNSGLYFSGGAMYLGGTGNATAFVGGGIFGMNIAQVHQTGTFRWSSATNFTSGNGDTGLSRGAAGKVYIGNGTAGDWTGTLIASNVGIGTVTPTSALQVSGTFTVSSTLTGANPALYVSSSGNVGIGTSAPSYALDVISTIRAPTLIVSGSGIKSASISHDGSGLIIKPSIQNQYLRLGDPALHSQWPNGIYHYGGAHNFFITSTTQAMIINTSGNVGIGTTAPSTTLTVSGSQLNTSWTAINMNRTAVAPLEVSGTISATAFVGDGSGLTGVVAGSSDRIVSGTNNATSMIAISATGYISITQGAAATNTGWFDPTTGYVGLGVSTTGTISGSAGYFSGNVGIGTSSPSSTLHVANGLITAGQTGNVLTGRYDLAQPSGGVGYFQLRTNNLSSNNGGLSIATLNAGLLVEAMRVTGSGNVGIGTTAPTSALQVSGTFTVSSTITGANPALYVSTSGYVGIRTASPNGILQVSGYRSNAPIFSNLWLDLGSTGGHAMGMITLNANGGLGVAGIGLQSSDSDNGDLTFSTRHASTWGEKIRIKSSGNVGIGTTAPSTTLTVSGSQLNTSWTAINMNRTAVAPLEVSGTISATALTINGQSVSGGDPDRIVSGTAAVIANSNGTVSVTTDLAVSGSIILAGNDAQACTPERWGSIRYVSATHAFQICRP